MSPDLRREKNRDQTRRQERDLAGTALQDLRDRCHSLSRLSEGKNVDGGVAATSSMSQPLATDINPMSHILTNRPACCENKILFRHGPLWPNITNPGCSRPSVGLFGMILAPLTNPYRYKRPNTAPDSSTWP